MDLLKMMMANRAAMGVVNDPQPVGQKAKPKAERAKKHDGGSKSMRHFIIEEKPGKKVVREHFKAMIEAECESSDDD
jgi:hypothetical protein